MARRVSALLLFAAAALHAQEAGAILNGLTVERYGVDAECDEEVATVVVEETFYNHGGGLAEADFYFPLPEAAAASGLQLSMGGKYYGGNLLTRREAGRIYEEITRRNRDPALLECIGKDLFRCRVFPVPGHDRASVKLAYRQPLSFEGSLRRLIVPLDAARFNRRPAGRFEFVLRIQTKAALQAVVCPTHDLEIVRRSAHAATLRLTADHAYLARDLMVLFSVDDAPLGAVLSSYRRAGQRGYFVLAVDAAFAAEKQDAAPRDVVIAVDTSNSTGRQGVDAAAAAVADLVAGLRAEDRYALLSFDTGARPLTPFLAPAAEAREEVRTLFAELPVAGRTDLAAGLEGAALLAASGRAGAGIIVLTDGQATATSRDAGAAVTAATGLGHRVGFCGLGYEVDAVVLEELGERGEGDAWYRGADRSLADGLRHLLETTRTVPLTNVVVQLEGAEELLPSRLRHVRAGDSILLAGRYSAGGRARATISALVAGERVERTFDLRLRESGGNPAIARIWAARRVGTLLAEAQAAGDPALHLREILSLGREFGIVTPHTSLLVLEEADQKRYLAGLRREPLLNTTSGGITLARLSRTLAAPPAADVAERLKRLQRCRSGDVDPFDDLLGINRARMRSLGDRAFYLAEDGFWTEAPLLEREPADPRRVEFLSKEWFELAKAHPDNAQAMALGRSVLFRLPDGTAVRVRE
ncbi:MAG: VIT domain-containing protein [Planctomycetaceae bacterium]